MHLKIIAILAIFAMIATSASSYGQTTQPQTKKHTEVFTQMQIRNSQGQLKAYLEPTIVKFGDPVIIKHYLDSKPKNIITKYGQKFEQIQFKEKGTFTMKHVMSDYFVTTQVRGGDLVLMLTNDGYPVEPGDSWEVLWTILVPVG